MLIDIGIWDMMIVLIFILERVCTMNHSLVGMDIMKMTALLDQLRVQLQKNIGEIKNGGLKR